MSMTERKKRPHSSATKRPKSHAKTGIVLPPTPRTDLKTIDDVRVEMAKVYRSVKSGEMDSQHGSRLVYILSQIGRMVESHEIEIRILALEARTKERRHA